MGEKSIIIIGAGMGGLAAGVYGRLNGYRTQIFEAHTTPGGQCTSWTRKGYTFDACIHHLFGCGPSSRLHQLWTELGAMPREMVVTEECTAVQDVDGRLFRDYYDPERLEQHLMELSSADAAVIKDYVAGTVRISKVDVLGELMMGSPLALAAALPRLLPLFKYFKPTVDAYAERFTDPFLRRAFALLVYSLSGAPLLIHLARHGLAITGAIKWPVGGAREFATSIERRYVELGGEIHYRQKVTKILVEHDEAVGVVLEDGSQHRADVVISNADGRTTIMDMLEGRYGGEQFRGYCAEPPDEVNWALHVFLGVNRDLSQEPSALVMLLDRPVTIAGHTTSNIEMQMYGCDPTMAPPGKGVIKVELVSSYTYWKELAADRSRYEEEKQRVADQVIDILERRFAGIRGQLEVVDVPTLLTWERFMGGVHGFNNMPVKKMTMAGSLGPRSWLTTLPGLGHFYFAGVWATSAGALFANALSGRRVIEQICRNEGRRFVTG